MQPLDHTPLRLLVAGGGYVGLATATGFARRGHMVDLIDVDARKTAELLKGNIPFAEASLTHAFRQELKASRIRIHAQYPGRLGRVDFAFICTPTPLTEDKGLDDAYVFAAAEAIVVSCDAPHNLVVRSTVSPGTTSRLQSWLSSSLNRDVQVLYNPEFLREGRALLDFEAPSRVVVGGANNAVVSRLLGLYSFVDCPSVVTNTTSAELIKLGANSALAVRVSMANEIAHLADSLGADVEAVLRGIGLDPRIGRDYLSPGIGFGGSCLPKDIAGIQALGQAQGIATAVFDGARRTNDVAIERIVERIKTLSAHPEETRVGIIGIAFKPGSDSLRGSQALRLTRALLGEGVQVTVFDPLAEQNTRIELEDSVLIADSVDSALQNANAGVIVDRSLMDGWNGSPGASVILIDGLGRDFSGSRLREEAPL